MPSVLSVDSMFKVLEKAISNILKKKSKCAVFAYSIVIYILLQK